MNIQLPRFDNLEILIMGDVMLDRYWHGETSRISPEAPVPVVHINTQQEYPGGAGNVALNVAVLGAKASLVGAIGNDADGQRLNEVLTQKNISAHLLSMAEHSTITKLRVLSRHQQLIRLDFEETHKPYDQQKLLRVYLSLLKQVDAVLLSDYGKGVLDEVENLIAAAVAAKIPVFVDPKNKPFSRYKGATLITPNFKEFREAIGDCKNIDAEIAEKGMNALEIYNIEAMLVTRSEQGMTLLQRGQAPFHLRAEAKEVFDVTGAGDTVISVLTTAFAAGQDLKQATALANLAASIVVGKLGAQPVSIQELKQALHQNHVSSESIVNLEQLLVIRNAARTAGKTVVMTNGCFDLIHPGHIAYLEQAKALGDILVIAVNDDASVGRLKAGRPINSLAQRMAVLSGLKPVDYVLPFSEDTPEKLIGEILPDLLVKGGDYKPEDIAGSSAVLKHGGQVKILDFKEGCSTTEIINRIKHNL